MRNRPDLAKTIERAAAGDESARTTVLTKILQLRWMGLDRDATHLAQRLELARSGELRDNGRPTVVDDGRLPARDLVHSAHRLSSHGRPAKEIGPAPGSSG